MGAIGESWPNANAAALHAVVGVEVSLRSRHDMLTVWVRSTGPERYMVAEAFKMLLGVDDEVSLEWKSFASSIRDGSTFRQSAGYRISSPQMKKKSVLTK